MLSFVALLPSLSSLVRCFLFSVQGFFGFGASPELEIELTDEDKRDKVTLRDDAGNPFQACLFSGQDAVSGTVRVKLPKGKKVEHTGIKVELVGVIGTSSFGAHVWPNEHQHLGLELASA